MNSPPVDAAMQNVARQADRAFGTALVLLVYGPLVAALATAALIYALMLTNVQVVAFMFVLPFVTGVCTGIPGILVGRRALKTADQLRTMASPAGVAIAETARKRGRWAVIFGVVTSVLGTAIVPLIDLVFLLAGAGAPGRPFRRGGRRVLPETQPGGTWCACVPPVPALEPRDRERRAEGWLADARAEHASIASFCDVTLDLLALGAPPSLVEQSLLAALDEVAHARLAFELASAFRGAPLSAGALPGASKGDLAGRLRLAAASLVDGQVNEGAAARRAREDATRADNPSERAALERIAEDESRHAALGERIVAWATTSPSVG